MTTKIKTLIIENLNIPNKIYNLDGKFEMSGIEFSIDKESFSKDKNLNSILNKYVYDKIKKELPSSKTWLVSISRVEDNKVSQYKISKHRKIWKSSIISKLEAEKFSYFSDDIIVDKVDNSLILAAMFEVNWNSFDDAVKVLKEHSSVFMFISSCETFNSEENIKDIYNYYYKQFYTSYHPSKGLQHLGKEDIFVRTGVIEEFCVPFIDFFLSPSQLLKMNL